MSNLSIAQLLRQRGASLKGPGGDGTAARGRECLIRTIAEDYPAFEIVRDEILGRDNHCGREQRGPAAAFVDLLQSHGLIDKTGADLVAAGAAARRFLSGGWLEELAWLAAHAAGADEALFSQEISWQVGEYHGENEIDLIMRRGGQLAFVSCKALHSHLSTDNRKHRNRLMDALHEADNLGDHFGQAGENVGVLVTTDLFDETRGQARYNALMGKASILNVRIIPLEELTWPKLTAALGELIKTRSERPNK